MNAGVPGGTLITNQAVVRSTELPNLLTDGDGNPATGPEPTVVVVGDVQQLSISKQWRGRCERLRIGVARVGPEASLGEGGAGAG